MVLLKGKFVKAEFKARFINPGPVHIRFCLPFENAVITTELYIILLIEL
jgi:hypothetical protein